MKQIKDETVQRAIRSLLDHRGCLWNAEGGVVPAETVERIEKLNALIQELKSLEPAPLPATLESREEEIVELGGILDACSHSNEIARLLGMSILEQPGLVQLTKHGESTILVRVRVLKQRPDQNADEASPPKSDSSDTGCCPNCGRLSIPLTDFSTHIHCLCGHAYFLKKVDGEWRVVEELIAKKLEPNPDIAVTPKEPAPPIGVMPRSIWIEHRLRDLHEAIGRRMEYLKTTELGKPPFDLQSHQWISEAFELSKELLGVQDKQKRATGGILIHRGDEILIHRGDA